MRSSQSVQRPLGANYRQLAPFLRSICNGVVDVAGGSNSWWGLALIHRLRGLELSHFRPTTAVLFVTMLATGLLTSCGGGTKPSRLGTPVGTYTLTITATAASGSGTLTHTTT